MPGGVKSVGATLGGAVVGLTAGFLLLDGAWIPLSVAVAAATGLTIAKWMSARGSERTPKGAGDTEADLKEEMICLARGWHSGTASGLFRFAQAGLIVDQEHASQIVSEIEFVIRHLAGNRAAGRRNAPGDEDEIERMHRFFRMQLERLTPPSRASGPSPTKESKERQSAATIDPKKEAALAILGLQRDASTTEVRKAFRQMALHFHPDRAAALGQAAQQIASDRFVMIREAYERLLGTEES